MIQRYRGALLGLAAGDALGTTVEFQPPGSFMPMQDIIGGGPFNLRAGEWTDDTSMALCIAESLIEKGFDEKDQLERYVKWYRDGHLSSNGRCFDIGNTIQDALNRFEKTGESRCGPTTPTSAGNGSIMRLAPVPLFYAQNPANAVRRSMDSSRTTHQAATCLDACRYLGGLIVGAVQGCDKGDLLSNHFAPLDDLWKSEPLVDPISKIAAGSFKERNPPDIRGTGYVVESLEAALWAFYHSDSFEQGALLAVNLGDDADTTGAVYGQLAGAYYGEEAIPYHWRAKLAKRQQIETMAERLFARAETPG